LRPGQVDLRTCQVQVTWVTAPDWHRTFFLLARIRSEKIQKTWFLAVTVEHAGRWTWAQLGFATGLQSVAMASVEEPDDGEADVACPKKRELKRGAF